VDLDLKTVNTSLRDASAIDVVQWALGLGRRTIATTSMGRNAAVMLNLVSEVDKSVPTIWVDTGYNLRDTYIVAERLIRDLEVNIHVYSPEMTSERRNAIMGGIPTAGQTGPVRPGAGGFQAGNLVDRYPERGDRAQAVAGYRVTG